MLQTTIHAKRTGLVAELFMHGLVQVKTHNVDCEPATIADDPTCAIAAYKVHMVAHKSFQNQGKLRSLAAFTL